MPLLLIPKYDKAQLIINHDSDMNQSVKQGQDRLTNIPNYSMP